MEYYHIEVQGRDETEMMPVFPYGLDVSDAIGVQEVNSMAVEALNSISLADSLSLRIAPQIGIFSSELARRSAGDSLTEERVADIVTQSMASLKIYVVESEITEAQNRVKAIVRQASY